MKDDIRNGNGTSLSENFASSAQRTLTIDVAAYQEFLDNPDMSPEQREDFLLAIWSVVVTFVELGFGVHPLQEISGKEGETGDQRPKAAFDQVRSKDQRIHRNDRDSGPSGSLEIE
ncbi:hypothetical protein [Nioella nitratireducens]|uniref:hypothetical protein n=1 Tax=Nioella nitratireducens TaxID=1287720 RepID=UPI0008FD4A61|nr:hypothetical protein [Nioella nitratireducens]